MDLAGNAIAVWRQSDGTRNSIRASRFVPGTGWGGAVLIGAENNGDVWFPSIAMDPHGNAVVVWSQSDGTRDNVWANRFVAGTGWGAAMLIETDDAGSASNPRVGVDPAGNAVAVWQQSDGIRDNIWTNRFVPRTGWGTAGVRDTATGNARNPAVSLSGSGDAMLVWEQTDGTRYNIWACFFGA
jgi:hypothetical protein